MVDETSPRPRYEKALVRRLSDQGFYRVQAVFFRGFNRLTPFEAAGPMSCSNTRAASACMPGKTCW